MKTTPRSSEPSLLETLGIHGLDGLDAVLAASLATEAPLLLIGPHGSGKTLLLNRVAEVLGLSHRHYNASLVNFDDLVGFPVPADGKVTYLQTPATIWEAESVFFDEISRCRPEVQNKLFPIIHERRVQGLPLPCLRLRFAAMNPPAGTGDHQDYIGTEPLDVALADRFPFIVKVPSFSDLSLQAQRRILNSIDWQKTDAETRLPAVVRKTRELIPTLHQCESAVVTEYTIVFAQSLRKSGHPVSTRRAALIVQNIIAVRAASIALETGSSREDDLCLAISVSIPDVAWGNLLEAATLLAAHRVAWEAASVPDDDLIRRLLFEPDPVERIALSLKEGVPSEVRTQALSDAFADLTLDERLVVAGLVMPALARRTDIPAATLEAIASCYARIAGGGKTRIVSGMGASDWKRSILSAELPRLDPEKEKDRLLACCATALMKEDFKFSFDHLAAFHDSARARLFPGLIEEAA
jgi:MoxR-like ATPase